MPKKTRSEELKRPEDWLLIMAVLAHRGTQSFSFRNACDSYFAEDRFKRDPQSGGLFVTGKGNARLHNKGDHVRNVETGLYDDHAFYKTLAARRLIGKCKSRHVTDEARKKCKEELFVDHSVPLKEIFGKMGIALQKAGVDPYKDTKGAVLAVKKVYDDLYSRAVLTRDENDKVGATLLGDGSKSKLKDRMPSGWSYDPKHSYAASELRVKQLERYQKASVAIADG